MSGERPLLLTGGRVVDPSQQLDEPRDLLALDGRIEAVERGIDGPEDADRVDVTGLVVAPGLVDVHVHLREPGGEHKETIRTGAMAAAAGGFTTIWAMPNTDPPLDDPAAVGYVRQEARRWARRGEGGARVSPVGAATQGLAGERMTAIGGLSSPRGRAKREGKNPSQALLLFSVMPLDAVAHGVCTRCRHERSEQPVEQRQQVAVVRVGLGLQARVMDLVHVGSDHRQR